MAEQKTGEEEEEEEEEEPFYLIVLVDNPLLRNFTGPSASPLTLTYTKNEKILYLNVEIHLGKTFIDKIN